MYDAGEQFAIPCVIMRGGTSKGIFFLERDLPASGAARDRLLKRLMGTPHAMQIDGIGGSNLLTSKIAIIGPPTSPDADIDYTFAQVEITRDVIDYAGNCGNISAAVAPFAIQAGLVAAQGEGAVVRVHNTNTGKILVSHVPLLNQQPRVAGSTRIPGVNGTGARIFMDYLDTVGAKSGKVLPTGNRVDTIILQSGKEIRTTICDVANPAAFVHASDLGMEGRELPAVIDTNPRLLDLLREMRGKAGVAMGLVDNWRQIDDSSPLLPFVMIVSEPQRYVGIGSIDVPAEDIDLCVRMIFMNHCHESMAGTGLMCIAAASKVPGSVANVVLSEYTRRRDTLRIGHPSGSTHISVRTRPANVPEGVVFEALGFERTARRIMDGAVYVPMADIAPAIGSS